jgi:hypothetical protein
MLSLYLDPESSVAPTGELVPFWSRFLVAFTRTAAQLQHVVAVDVSDDPANALNAPAQGFVIATTRGDAGVRPTDVAFGQLLVSPGSQDSSDTERSPGEPASDGAGTAADHGSWSSRLVVDFHLDAGTIARDVLTAFAAVGVRELLVVRRQGRHEYVDRIVAQLTAAADDHSPAVAVTDLNGPTLAGRSEPDPVQPAEVAGWLSEREAAGVLMFGQAPAVRAGVALAGRSVTTQAAEGVPVMVQMEVPAVRTDATMYLTMQGSSAGRIVAESVVRALATGEAVNVVLNHAIVT